MKRMFYYAKLNSDNVCVGFASYPKKYENVEGLILLPEYNESYLYRKWLGDQWSQETFEPSIPEEVNEKLEYLEAENEQLRNEVISLNDTITNLNQNINLLENSIVELTNLIALLQGGDI